MGLKSYIYKELSEGAIKAASDQQIHLEAAIRGIKKGGAKSGSINKTNTYFTVKSLSDWKNAIAAATDPTDPNFVLLAELYENLLLDNHLVATIENRIYKALQSKFTIKTASGEENTDLKVLFQSPWFEDFIRFAMWSKFTGVKVLELAEIDDNLELIRVTNIPMSHLVPHKGIFTKEEGEEHGWDYKEGQLARFYIQVGEDNQLGIFKELAPMVFAKKLAIGSWLDYVQKFGVPARWVVTDREDSKRLEELFDMMQDMMSNQFAVLRGNEKIEIDKNSSTDAHQVFNELISRVNSEMSKMILGQDGTSDHKESTGTYGSMKVLQEVANDRHESDKLFIKHLINNALIPRLIQLSSFYSGLTNHAFDWDDSQEMTQVEFVDTVVKLSNAGFALDTEQIQEKTGLTIIGMKQVAPAGGDDDLNKGGNAPKKPLNEGKKKSQ